MKVGSDRESGTRETFAVYIVDYDLPRGSRRKRFYRAIDRYLRLNDSGEAGLSTMSVVVTRSSEFAWFVWREARKVGGTSHIYEAWQLDKEL